MQMEDKNILILTPSLDNSGGVANYYSIMRHKLPFKHHFFIVGNREKDNDKNSMLSNPVVRLITDYLRFIKKLWLNNYDMVLINPSLNMNGIFRDYIFYLLAKLHNKKTIIFFRGWDDDCANKIFYGKWRLLFKPLLNSDGFIVLAQSFKDFLIPLTKKSSIFLESTVFDESMLLDSHDSIYKLKQLEEEKIRLLFLSRIEKDKGVYESIEAYKKLRALSINVELVIAGSGSEADNVKKIVASFNDKNLRYVGRVGGEDKNNLLLSSSILLFPSKHAEGMPNTVLEALGCGQAVLSPKVGGLHDFFNGDTMGAELCDDNVKEIVDTIVKLYNDRELLGKISLHNYEFAKKYFYSNKVSMRLNNIINAVLHNTECEQVWISR